MYPRIAATREVEDPPSAQQLDERTVHEHRAPQCPVTHQQQATRMARAHVVLLEFVTQQPAAFVDAIRARIVELGPARVCRDVIRSRGELAGMPDVILVGKRDEVVFLDRRLVDEFHERARLALVRGVVDDLEVLVLSGVGLENPEGVVGGAVIGNAQGDLDALLVENAVELFREMRLAVIGGHEHEYARVAGHDSPFAATQPCPSELAEGQGFEPWRRLSTA